MRYTMLKKLRNFKNLSFINKYSYILAAILFISIPSTGLVLESLNINIISFEMIFALYVLTLLVSLLGKSLKLAILVTIGSLIIWAITLGVSEVLCYLLKEYFDIDISYR